MNQRYHQHEASVNGSLDMWAKVVTAMLAMAGFGLALAAPLAKNEVVDWSGVLVSVLAAIAAIYLNVMPFGAKEKEHVDLFRRWTDLREDVDRLEFDLGSGEPSELLSAQLAEMDAKLHRICGAEPLANAKLWRACQRAEQKSRGIAVLADEPPSRLADWIPPALTRRSA